MRAIIFCAIIECGDKNRSNKLAIRRHLDNIMHVNSIKHQQIYSSIAAAVIITMMMLLEFVQLMAMT